MENMEDFSVSHNYTQRDLLLLQQQQQQQPYTPRSSVLNSVLWCPLRFSHKICSHRLYHQLFVGELMFYLRYLCLFRIVVSNTYCVVFLLCFSSSCVPCATSVFGLSIFCILYCLLSTKKHATIASGFQSNMNVKNIANLVSFLVSSHWSPSQRNIWISRPPSTTNMLWIHIPALWQVHIYFV